MRMKRPHKMKVNKTVKIEVRVTPEQKERLMGAAKELGLTLTDLTLFALSEVEKGVNETTYRPEELN